MCGIVGGLGEPSDAALRAISHRGPDARAIVRYGRWWFGHARLSIIDVGAASNQPFRRDDLVVVYNGELWNFQELRAELSDLGETFRTAGDTEVFVAAVSRWGVSALSKMQGMFAAAWSIDGQELHLVRDRHGEVPLHVNFAAGFHYASELKAFRAMGLNAGADAWVEPGEHVTVSARGARRYRWYDVPQVVLSDIDRRDASLQVRECCELGSVERTVSDVPVCTLLSGGIDSAVVAAHAMKRLPDLVGYVAVMDPKSPDVRAAREVAAHLGMKLVEVSVPAPSADDLAAVVRAIEMPHKAQVEIGWACMVLADQIRADGFRVTLSGEGSDELWASYGFSYHGIQQDGWYGHRRRLFRDQHRKNFARCNKVFMSRGIECRLPFLCTSLVELALSLPMAAVRAGKARPKAVLSDGHADMLPSRVLTRPKMAFQDGMGLKDRCAEAIYDPAKFYRAIHDQEHG